MPWQKSSSKTSSDVPSRLLRSTGNSDTPLDDSGMEKDDGWLDQNPEAKLYLSNLSTEETISDDEVEVRWDIYIHLYILITTEALYDC